jgi:D-3-phosphoglycerate dehydrogenase
MLRILLPDGLEQVGIDVLEEAGLEVIDWTSGQGEGLRDALLAVDGCIIRSSTRLTADVLGPTGRLKAVVRAGVGLDNIDLDAASRVGVAVMNTPNGNTTSAAELTIALMLALARRLPDADRSTKSGRWERAKLVGMQVAHKTIGIVGLGRIGQKVARLGRGLDMVPIGFDSCLDPEVSKSLGLETTNDLGTLLRRCDFLTVHVPLNAATRGLISAEDLRLLKPTAFVLNVARGGVIDEYALAEALRSGQIAGAAVDVFTSEPIPSGHPLLDAPNVILTPHLGASTREAQEAVAREAAGLLVRFLMGGDTGIAIDLQPHQDEDEMATTAAGPSA